MASFITSSTSQLAVPATQSSQSQPRTPAPSRRSTRPSPARKDPSFVPTSPDSRRSLYIPGEDEDEEESKGKGKGELEDEDLPEEEDKPSGERSADPHTPTKPKKRPANDNVHSQRPKKVRKKDTKKAPTRAKVTVSICYILINQALIDDEF